MKNTDDSFMLGLSNFFNPISALFEEPKNVTEWEQYVLSKAHIEFCKENKYLSGIKILNDKKVDALLNEELVRPEHGSNEDRKLFYCYEGNESEDPNKVLFYAIGAWRVTQGFNDLIPSSAYRMAAYQLLGQPIRLFNDQLFCKPAKHGGMVAWHQDFSYWTFTKPMQHLTCWIALDDANVENSCLYYNSCIHEWNILPVTGLTDDMDAVKIFEN